MYVTAKHLLALNFKALFSHNLKLYTHRDVLTYNGFENTLCVLRLKFVRKTSTFRQKNY